jgi:diguanylate cyclase (GGDEF)-like protein
MISHPFSLKALYNLGVALMFLALILVGWASLKSLETAIKHSDVVVGKALTEIHYTMALRLALSQAAMPVNDHVIHAHPTEQENYQQLSITVEHYFDMLSNSRFLNAFQNKSLNMARDKWNQAKKTGDAIMQIRNPTGNTEAARQMEQFDLIIDHAIGTLSNLYESIYQQTLESHDKLHNIESRAQLFIMILAALSIALAAIGSLMLARSFFPPVRSMLDGVRLFGQGNLEHRIDHDMPKEFKELAHGINSMADELGQIHGELKDAAMYDELTGCFNRRYLDQDIIKSFSQSKRTGENLSLMMLDLDYFKKVNDTYGHAVGDEVLRSAAALIRKQLRQHEILYRYGGEEFTIILPASEEADALQLAERIRAGIADNPIDIGGEECLAITISIGIASYPQSAKSINELFKMADQALYAAKENGRNCSRAFSN